jgi:hypothetical protein
MSLDITPYRHHLDGFDLSEAQKAEIIRSVYLVMESFVDLAFGTDATQICLGIKGDPGGGRRDDPLDSMPQIHSTFNDAATGSAAGTSDP